MAVLVARLRRPTVRSADQLGTVSAVTGRSHRRCRARVRGVLQHRSDHLDGPVLYPTWSRQGLEVRLRHQIKEIGCICAEEHLLKGQCGRKGQCRRC